MSGGARKSAVTPTKSLARVEQRARMETCLLRRARALMGFAVAVRGERDARRVIARGASFVCGGRREVRMDPMDEIAVSACHFAMSLRLP